MVGSVALCMKGDKRTVCSRLVSRSSNARLPFWRWENLDTAWDNEENAADFWESEESEEKVSEIESEWSDDSDSGDEL